MNTITLFQKFRQLVYQILPKRADATLDLVDALTVARHVDSPVALSEEAPFRRKFSSVYDVLSEGDIDEEKLHPILYEQQPEDCEEIGGYESKVTPVVAPGNSVVIQPSRQAPVWEVGPGA
jgi:hypothetical protein